MTFEAKPLVKERESKGVRIISKKIGG